MTVNFTDAHIHARRMKNIGEKKKQNKHLEIIKVTFQQNLISFSFII